MTATDPTTNRALTSTYADGQLVLAWAPHDVGQPKPDEVVIAVEAAPVNPSDLAGMFGPVPIDGAQYGADRMVIAVPGPLRKPMAAREGLVVPLGNEGAGRVVAAGASAAAQALMGKRVAGMGGGFYARFVRAKAANCLTVGEDVIAEQAAGAFVNPLTALGFVETIRVDGFTGIVHTAAASNLGQMLVKLCAADGVPLVNIVRTPSQVALLRGLGAEHVLDSAAPDFPAALVDAIAATGAMCAFDAIGGGRLASNILTAMEQVASKSEAYSRYGSEVAKRVYIYGMLDPAPIVLGRGFGFSWDVSGWLLMRALRRLGADVATRMMARVARDLTTIFASHYHTRLTVPQFLTRENIEAANAKTTGTKFLLLPGGRQSQ